MRARGADRHYSYRVRSEDDTATDSGKTTGVGLCPAEASKGHHRGLRVPETVTDSRSSGPARARLSGREVPLQVRLVAEGRRRPRTATASAAGERNTGTPAAGPVPRLPVSVTTPPLLASVIARPREGYAPGLSTPRPVPGTTVSPMGGVGSRGVCRRVAHYPHGGFSLPSGPGGRPRPESPPWAQTLRRQPGRHLTLHETPSYPNTRETRDRLSQKGGAESRRNPPIRWHKVYNQSGLGKIPPQWINTVQIRCLHLLVFL